MTEEQTDIVVFSEMRIVQKSVMVLCHDLIGLCAQFVRELESSRPFYWLNLVHAY